jgi:hypothetical protein
VLCVLYHISMSYLVRISLSSFRKSDTLRPGVNVTLPGESEEQK